ncbi:MAG: ATP-binding protein [Pseudobdellovibrio sp.]
MKKEIKLSFINNLEHNKKSDWDWIQVIVGPRQVGKTTGIQQYLEGLQVEEYHYASADGPILKGPEWLVEQWLTLSKKSSDGVLVIDEVQKIEKWSEALKNLWDQQKRKPVKIKVIVLGSSSLEIQKGLSESLTGRFVLHKVYQWNFSESLEGYGLGLDEFLKFGGYPGSYNLRSDLVKWLSYVKESIVDTVIGRDILQLSRVKSPALFRQCFDLACSYGGQEISYTKLLGQLQDKGNVDLIKHYLELFEGAFLLKQLFKYSNKKTLSRSSSPKILPLCPSLYTITKDADLDEESRGRAFEIAVGCELARLPGSLYYWREGNKEVDYVYVFGKKLFAIEVKSGRKKAAKGLVAFKNHFPNAIVMLITPDNFSTFRKELNII